jgi:hypothetical protein
LLRITEPVSGRNLALKTVLTPKSLLLEEKEWKDIEGTTLPLVTFQMNQAPWCRIWEPKLREEFPLGRRG